MQIPTNKNFKDLTGKTFSQLTVLEYAGKRNVNHYWRVQCDCSNQTIKIVRGTHMVSGRTISCGCYLKISPKIHNVTHGKSNSRIYKNYIKLIERCNNPTNQAFKNYGGRGIKCLFNSFEEFYEELGEPPSKEYSIDRIDNNKSYEKGNVRWSTSKEQNRNRRDNYLITIDNQTKTMSEWAEMNGINNKVASGRIHRNGWCDYCAVTIPPNKRGQSKVFCPHK